ncbi:uncharacterized protein LOC144660811 [Oculina patagonica]
MKLPFAIVLLFSSIAVYSTFAGRISDKIREKRSYEYNCEEKVFSSSPICNKKTCPDGIHGRPEFVYYHCNKLPVRCPMKEKDEAATCCPEKCVCGDGKTKYGPGETFKVVRDREQWECKCGEDEVPKCEPIFTVPPKEPPRPPPVFPPPGLFPPQ